MGALLRSGIALVWTNYSVKLSNRKARFHTVLTGHKRLAGWHVEVVDTLEMHSLVETRFSVSAHVCLGSVDTAKSKIVGRCSAF